MKELPRTLSFIKEHWWLFWLGGILYQWFFLVINNALSLFSWSQIPADTVLFVVFTALALLFFLPWIKYEDKIFEKWWSNLLVRLFYSGLIFTLFYLINTAHFVEKSISKAITDLFILSVIFGLFSEIKILMGKKNYRDLVIVALIFISLTYIGWNYYESLSVIKNEKTIWISYMNDNYIILKDWEIIKNTDSIVLTRNRNSVEK